MELFRPAGICRTDPDSRDWTREHGYACLLYTSMATILSAAMMLRYTFGLGQEADAIENAVKSVLDQGYRTPDLFAGEGTLVGTAEMGRRIAEAI